MHAPGGMLDLFDRGFSRRGFLKGLAAGVGAFLCSAGWPRPQEAKAAAGAAPLPTRYLGKTGVPVTILGCGGEGVLRTWGRQAEAVAVIRRALERGITYFDTAPAYSGSQDYYGEALGADRARIFLASKTHDRSYDGSQRLLDQSLKRLRTDHLDLWQLHDLRERGELDAIFGRQGALRAMEQARSEGKVRFLGITGHTDPAVLLEAVRRYPFDTALVALNVADRQRLSFIQQFLPTAREERVGVIGMKVLARGALLSRRLPFTLDQVLGYVLSQAGVSTAIVGFDDVAQVDEAVEAARRFEPLTAQEMTWLETQAAPYAPQMSYFKRPA